MAAGRILIEKNVEVPMRDGVKTYADVYRPDVGEPVPAVVTRTPYNKEPAIGGLPVMPGPLPLAQEGYAVVVADTRGRFSSEGAFEPFVDEELDGYDTIEWAAAQPWCDGGTAVYGPSYIGATTMLAAKSRPPSLRCAIPIITPHDYFDAWVYQGGAFQLGFSTWWGQMLAQTNLLRADHGVADEHVDELLAAAFAGMEPFRARPLSQMPGLAAPEVAPYWQRWLEHDRRDDYWNGTSLSGNDFSDLDIPMFHVSGWFDIFGLGSFRNFTGMQRAGASQQRLWVGPWSHVYYDRYLGELDFGVLGARPGLRRPARVPEVPRAASPRRGAGGRRGGPLLPDGRQRVARRGGLATTGGQRAGAPPAQRRRREQRSRRRRPRRGESVGRRAP